MKKFEYNVLNLKTLTSEHLNSLGEDGWQVCHIEKSTGYNFGAEENLGYQIVLMREEETNPLENLSKMLGALNIPTK